MLHPALQRLPDEGHTHCVFAYSHCQCLTYPVQQAAASRVPSLSHLPNLERFFNCGKRRFVEKRGTRHLIKSVCSKSLHHELDFRQEEDPSRCTSVHYHMAHTVWLARRSVRAMTYSRRCHSVQASA